MMGAYPFCSTIYFITRLRLDAVSFQKPPYFPQIRATQTNNLMNRFIDTWLGTGTGLVRRRSGSEFGWEVGGGEERKFRSPHLNQVVDPLSQTISFGFS